MYVIFGWWCWICVICYGYVIYVFGFIGWIVRVFVLVCMFSVCSGVFIFWYFVMFEML